MSHILKATTELKLFAKFHDGKKKNTRKDNLSLPLSHRFMLSLSKVIH